MARDLLSRIAAIKTKRKERGQPDNEGDSDHNHNHHGNCCFSHSHPLVSDTATSEHYISSSDLEDEPDNACKPFKTATTFPTLTRLEGAKPEAVEDCDTSEEESD